MLKICWTWLETKFPYKHCMWFCLRAKFYLWASIWYIFFSWEFVCFDNVIYAWNWEIESERASEREIQIKTRIQFVWCFRRNREGKKNKFDIWANKIANTYLTTMLALVEHNYIFFTIFVISHRLINVLINKRWFNAYVIWSVFSVSLVVYLCMADFRL